jgi:hypothetical protein
LAAGSVAEPAIAPEKVAGQSKSLGKGPWKGPAKGATKGSTSKPGVPCKGIFCE